MSIRTSTRHLRSPRAIALAAALLPWVATVLVASGPAPQAPSVPTARRTADPILAARMRGHFDQAFRATDAVIRGDLAGAREPARWIAEHPPDRVPPLDARYVGEIQQAAARTAAAADLDGAAASAASMLATCGDCHRASGARPSPPPPLGTNVGGIVGHMVAHQQAVDLMVQGLIIPSARAWEDGAARLAVAPLRPAMAPPDRQLRAAVFAAEQRTHALAERARTAASPTARATVFAEVIAGCASCHGLHPGVWGPKRP
jgi:cytochrome c553